MAQKKVTVIFGTRPEAIKMAPLVKVLKQNPHFDTRVIVTAQHRQMLDQVLDLFEIIPDYDLDIMQPNQTLFDITTRILLGLQQIFQQDRPDLILVHGDTTTTFAASLAAFYEQIAIGHVEAGLRTRNKYSPFPEEMNRQLTGVLSDLHFAPTAVSEQNLLREGKDAASIFVTGNTAIDALNTTVRDDYTHPMLEKLSGKRLVLLTAHRRENLGSPMRHIFEAILRLLDTHEDIEVVYPVHLNPKIRTLANEVFGERERIHLIEPLDVLDFHNFAARATLILTDSGGVQEEAPSLGVPVLVLRDTTERPEGVDAGTLRLVGTDAELIYETAHQLLTDEAAYAIMAKASNPYGDGHASERISEAITSYFTRERP